MASELVKTPEENNNIYIELTKKNIDNYIRNSDYQKAFLHLIMFLERLDNDDKVECIDYYSKKLCDLTRSNSHLQDRRFDFLKRALKR